MHVHVQPAAHFARWAAMLSECLLHFLVGECEFALGYEWQGAPMHKLLLHQFSAFVNCIPDGRSFQGESNCLFVAP